jgi:uncharacterized integral membrane protein
MIRLSLYFFLWISAIAIAIFSSQNIYPIVVKFISFESIKLPLGLVLIFCAGLGATFMTFLMAFPSKSIQSTNFPINFSTKTSVQKPQKVATPKNESTNKKSIAKDDFDDDQNDDWI